MLFTGTAHSLNVTVINGNNGGDGYDGWNDIDTDNGIWDPTANEDDLVVFTGEITADGTDENAELRDFEIHADIMFGLDHEHSDLEFLEEDEDIPVEFSMINNAQLEFVADFVVQEVEDGPEFGALIYMGEMNITNGDADFNQLFVNYRFGENFTLTVGENCILNIVDGDNGLFSLEEGNVLVEGTLEIGDGEDSVSKIYNCGIYMIL